MWGYMGKKYMAIFFLLLPWISLSEQKESLVKSLASVFFFFFLQGVTQTPCVKWELPGCDFSRKHPLAIVCPVNFCRPQCPDFHTWEIKGYQGAIESGVLNVRGDKPSTKYSFPLHVWCLSGVSAGVTDTATGFFLMKAGARLVGDYLQPVQRTYSVSVGL